MNRIINLTLCCLLLSFCSLIGQENYSSKQLEGKARLEAFKNFRYNGDFAFKFELSASSRGNGNRTYYGVLYGSWNTEGPMFRMELWKANDPHKRAQVLIKSGPSPRVWRLSKERSIEELSPKEWFDPLFEDLPYTPFDLLMNYLYWTEYSYDGEGEALGRTAYMFYMYAPKALKEANKDLGGVSLAMDDKYNAILRADVLNPLGQRIRSMRVLNFKKVHGQYVVNKVDYIDDLRKDRVRMSVMEAAMGLKLDFAVFDPEVLASGLPRIDRIRFSRIR